MTGVITDELRERERDCGGCSSGGFTRKSISLLHSLPQIDNSVFILLLRNIVSQSTDLLTSNLGKECSVYRQRGTFVLQTPLS